MSLTFKVILAILLTAVACVLLLPGCATLPEKMGACANACNDNMAKFDAITDSCLCHNKAVAIPVYHKEL